MARAEITGKKTTAADRVVTRRHNRGPPLADTDGPKYRRKPPSADPQALALSIHAFCVLHGISQDMYFKMQRDGWGPKVMSVGSRSLISQEAAAQWRAEREAAALEQENAA